MLPGDLKSPVEQNKFLLKELGGDKFDAVLNVSGGWAGGNAGASDLIENAEAMINSSLYTSLICAHIASLCSPKVLMLPGAAPVIGGTGTGFMIPYGVAKAGVHQLLASLSDPVNGGLDLEKTKVLGIAPVTIDTEMNRKNMPDAAPFDSWTKTEELAEQIMKWCEDPSAIEQGAMYKVVTEKGATQYVAGKP